MSSPTRGAAPATGWRALPRKAVTALRLVWRRLRKLRALPGFLNVCYESSLVPRWNETGGRWEARFAPGRYLGALGRGLAALLIAKPVVYRANLAAARSVRPRLLHVIPNVFVGGSTQLIYDICGALGARYDMRILTSALPQSGRHEGVPIEVLPHKASLDAARAAFARFAPQIVHIHYWGDVDRPWYETMLAAAAECGARVVLNVNTPVEPLRHPAIAETVFVSDYVRRTFGPDIAAARTIHPGIDLDRFGPPPAFDADAMRSIGMVYRLEPDKLRADSIDVLIEACKARPRTRAIVIGGGSLFGAFVRRTRAAGLRGQFHFTGPVPYANLPGLYRRFRIFVAPVWQESFGQVTPFAMSMGLAVAGNKIGALPEILGSEETLGGDNAATAARIVALLDDPARIAALGAENAARARAAYDVKAMVAAYEALYADLLGEAVDPMAGFPPALVFAA